MIRLLLLCFLLFSSLLAKQEPRPAELIFDKKCGMCHLKEAPDSMEQAKAMVAPYMFLAMRSIYIGIDAIEDPATKVEHKQLTLEFLKDYMLEPHRDKSFCEDIIFEKFQTMPSMKGFISEEELDIVLPYVYETFAPQKEYEDLTKE